MKTIRTASLCLGTAIVIAIQTASSASYAQDAAAAKALFEKGVADMGVGSFSAACPEIGESYKLDPRPGTLFTLAECFNHAGKTASAVARYEDYLGKFDRMSPDDRAKQNGRDATAREQRDKLKPHVPWLTLRLPADAPAATIVSRDGEAQGSATLGLALPIDPGSHVITVQVAGAEALSQTVVIVDDDKKEITLEVKREGPSAEVKSDGGGRSDVARSPSAPPPATPSEAHVGGNGQRTAGFVVGGIGVAGLLVGAIAGGLTLSKKSTIEDHCEAKSKVCRDRAGVEAADSARTTGVVSTVGFIAGGAAIVGGAILLLTAPRASSKVAGSGPRFSWSIGPGGGGVGITKEF